MFDFNPGAAEVEAEIKKTFAWLHFPTNFAALLLFEASFRALNGASLIQPIAKVMLLSLIRERWPIADLVAFIATCKPASVKFNSWKLLFKFPFMWKKCAYEDSHIQELVSRELKGDKSELEWNFFQSEKRKLSFTIDVSKTCSGDTCQ